jgi:hypothetical protein
LPPLERILYATDQIAHARPESVTGPDIWGEDDDSILGGESDVGCRTDPRRAEMEVVPADNAGATLE